MATTRQELEVAYEAQDRAREHRKRLKDMASLPLGGKSTKMGEGYLFNKDGTAQNEKAAEQAYDAVANIHESMAEDAEEGGKRAVKRWEDKSAEELAQEKAAAKKKGGRPELY